MDIMSDGESRGGWLKRELEVVMKAGNNHPRNYYAWWYGRLLVRYPFEKEKSVAEGSECEKDGNVWRECVWMVHRWCLGHPRDISGWSFMVFLMDRRHLMIAHERDWTPPALEVIGNVFHGTEEFVQKYKWRGESIEWFSKSKKHFHASPNG